MYVCVVILHRPTFVHRFIIENTVEEKLRELLASRQERAELIVK